ncbi:unnamed protein product [Clonostachys rosea]|uniref:NmrA-like domain-containing protein n=1 Tax=Bionectria ochroleuca TaxID=29856 RepID=A0ABY6UD26_BIOOC|nr:unnamed protein product [Clonostachys rosea]
MAISSVFVCGVTGVQGGALARELLAKGVTVHSVSREIDSEKSKAIQSLGVKLWHGNFDNEKALKAAIAGTQAVYLNLVPNFSDPSGELRQAKLIIKIAKESGVSHLVQGSGIGFDVLRQSVADQPDSSISTMAQNKLDIEAEVRNAGFPTFTILRPGTFMTNFLSPFIAHYPGLADNGRWIAPVQPETALPIVDPKTIGVFAAAAILDPARFNRKEVAYADEILPVGELLQKLGKAAGKNLELVPLSDDEVEAQKKQNPFIYVQLTMREIHKEVDVKDVKSWNLPLSSFDAFLEGEKEKARETFANVP